MAAVIRILSLWTLLLIFSAVVAYTNQTLNYSGPFTNTTFDVHGNVVIHLNIGTDNTLSGYMNFTENPGEGTICGAGDFTGSIQESSIEFSFTSRDLDTGCGFDWGSNFTVTGTLSEDRRVLEGNYFSTSGQQGIFQVTALPTVSNPPTPLTSQLTYPEMPTIQEDANTLVVVLHGCCTPPDSDVSFWEDMVSSLQKPGRVIWLYDWQKDSGRIPSLSSLPQTDIFPFFTAYNNAVGHGKWLGTNISTSSYKYVHFIGHSAGSNLIHNAIKTIKMNKENFGLNDPIIHATFLDAYTPFAIEKFFYGEDLENDDYAEHYVALRLPLTDASLWKAYNFDVTALPHSDDHSRWLNHFWPIHWYQESIDKAGEYGFGFPLSFEYGGNGGDPSTFYVSRKQSLQSEHTISAGGVCVLTSNTACIPNPNVLVRPVIVYVPLLGSLINEAIRTSVTGAVEWVVGDYELVGVSATLRTNSPVWFEASITTSMPFNLFKFDYEFLSVAESEGILTVYVDDQLVYKVDERITDPGINVVQDIPVGGHSALRADF